MTALLKQRGQALTEFLVVALALVPLFLLLPMIAKYQDIAHATQVASRYAAFEAMAHNDGMSAFTPVAQLRDEVVRRHLGDSRAPIKSNDVAGNFDAHRNPFWRDQQGNPLIKDFGSDVQLSFGLDGKGADHASAFQSASDDVPFALARGALGLKAPGLYTANVSVKLASLPGLAGSFAQTYEGFADLDLSMTRHTTLVVDSWTGRDPAQVQGRLDHPVLAPGSMLAAINPVVNAAVAIVESPACLDSKCPKTKLGELDFWQDVVPSDRVKK